MDSQIVAVVIAVLGTLAVPLSLPGSSGRPKDRGTGETGERYKAEIRARQAEEDAAAEWLAELDVANTPSCCQDAAARTNRAKTRHTSEHRAS